MASWTQSQFRNKAKKSLHSVQIDDQNLHILLYLNFFYCMLNIELLILNVLIIQYIVLTSCQFENHATEYMNVNLIAVYRNARLHHGFNYFIYNSLCLTRLLTVHLQRIVCIPFCWLFISIWLCLQPGIHPASNSNLAMSNPTPLQLLVQVFFLLLLNWRHLAL
jgi:hypothetical protein